MKTEVSFSHSVGYSLSGTYFLLSVHYEVAQLLGHHSQCIPHSSLPRGALEPRALHTLPTVGQGILNDTKVRKTVFHKEGAYC